MKITITNAYTWYNKGDAGILLGIVDTLKKIYSNDLEINVLSFTPDEDKKRYCKDSCIKNVYSNVLNPHPYNHNKVGKIVAILKLLISFIYQMVMINVNSNCLKKKRDNYRTLDQSDLIIVCGGGFLGGKKFDSLMHLFQIYINTKFKKKVIMMGTSIEPITNKFIKRITEKVLKRVDYIYAREIITYNYLTEFLDKDKFVLIPDMAFMLEDIKKTNDIIEKYKNNYDCVYGITVRKWNFPGEKDGNQKYFNYKKTIASFIEYKAKKDNSLFVFIPQVIVEHGNDATVAKEIKKMIPSKYQKNFLIIEDDLTPIEIKSLIWNCDFFIGTRMHSNIFATSMCIPTIAIAYEKKTNGIMHTVELDDYVIEMSQVTLEQLIEVSNKQYNEKLLIINHLNSKIKEIREDILKKIEIILKEK